VLGVPRRNDHEGARGAPTPRPRSGCCAAELAPGDVVLFKSSRDAGLRLLGDRMAQDEEELT
jgi:UDP-N-acetylmuramoyl-tripeptide--D-alanyl-D-alanine ligase